MGQHLFFDHEFSYKDEEEGISLPVKLTYGGQIVAATAYLAKYPGVQHNLLERQGWLRNLRLAIIDYDNLLYLSDYNS